jgi:hypothetical protein
MSLVRNNKPELDEALTIRLIQRFPTIVPDVASGLGGIAV